MKLEFGYDHRTETVELPEENLMGILEPNSVELPDLSEETLVRQALQQPIGSKHLRELVHPGEKIVIITSDISRPMPTAKVLPPVLDELEEAGVNLEDVTVIFARGIHRPHTVEEQKKLMGDAAYGRVRCMDSDPDDTILVGTTSRQTPVEIMRAVVEADRRICLGNIEFHYFAGFSGGAKAIMPGVSTRSAIQNNHRFMTDPESYAGHLEGNPVREDLEEAVSLLGIDFICNVVLDEHKKIIHAVAGDWILAHRAGCRFLEQFYLKPLDQQADIVLVSQGGAPKDANLYQTQKALDNAKHAVRPGGIIILIGSCKEGFGEKTFEQWLTEEPTPDSLIDRLHRNFTLGGHKAAAIALVRRNASIYLVSDLPDDVVRDIFMEPFASAQQALDAAFEVLGKDAKVLSMPYGGSTLPTIRRG
jgi:nickel-dependent lactate racemase